MVKYIRWVERFEKDGEAWICFNASGEFYFIPDTFGGLDGFIEALEAL
jgi:hypothetical protein